MLAVTIIPQDRFIFHRFLTDALGHLIGSYVTVLVSYGIDPHSDRDIDFNHGLALSLAAAFIVCDFLIARFFGNRKWFGLVSLLAASVTGYILFWLSFELYGAMTRPSYLTPDLVMSIVGMTGMSPLFLIPALLFALIIRLMAYPIIRVFKPDA